MLILATASMSTMPNSPFTPIRREEILRLSIEIRNRFADTSIDEIARTNDIVLVRSYGPFGKDAGFACINFIEEPLFIESLARPSEKVQVWGRIKKPVRSIVINPNAGIPEREVFWHEYFHLFYSSHTVQRSERFVHHFSTEGALHYQEERRADEFAAAVLIPSIRTSFSIVEIAERFAVSDRLAKCAVQFYRQISEL